MIKYNYPTITVIIIILLCVNNNYSAPADFPWGAGIHIVSQGIGRDSEYSKFRLSDMDGYKNIIVSYMTDVDKNIKNDIVVLRTKSGTVTDYIFVKDRLYTVSRDWNIVDTEKEAWIRRAITDKYGTASVKEDGGFWIYSYSTGNTKVLYYRVRTSPNTYRCRVYYYTKNLFKMLLMQN